MLRLLLMLDRLFCGCHKTVLKTEGNVLRVCCLRCGSVSRGIETGTVPPRVVEAN